MKHKLPSFADFMITRKQNVLTMLEDKTSIYARKTALGMKTEYGWKELTFEGLGMMSRKIATYFMNDLCLKRKEKVAILSESKPEFGACIFASLLAGLITVPLDIKLTIHELTSILNDCQPSIILVSQKYLSMAIELKEKVPSLKHILLIDENYVPNGYQSIYTIPSNYSCHWKHRARRSTVLIIYTSGTTGAPKGVETTMGNIMTQLEDLRLRLASIFPRKGDVRILSILPMNHLFEMTVGFATFLNFGFSVYYTQSLKPKDILNTIKDRKIQFMILVPAFLKLLKTSLEAEVKKSSKFYQYTFQFRYHLAKIVPFKFIKKLMFKKLHDCFGGSFMGCLSGGAPLDLDVVKFFKRIGIDVFQGYGLTETSPVAAVNIDKRSDMSSVGTPLKSFEVKIDESTGELLLKGPSIMKGYHNQPELTAQVIDKDGWFKTGDIAKIDKKGRIYITGRIKNLIVLSGGKKVFPEEVEAVMEQSELFEEACVLGVSRDGGAKDGTEDVAVAILPKQYLIEQHSEEELESIIRTEIKRLSQRLAAYKRPMNINIVKEPMPRTKKATFQRNKVLEMIKKK